MLEQYQALQKHSKTHFRNKSKCKMFCCICSFDITHLLESFNNCQNRSGLKYSRQNSYRVSHFQAARTI